MHYFVDNTCLSLIIVIKNNSTGRHKMSLSDAVIKNYLDAHSIESKNSHDVLYALNVWTDKDGTNCTWILVSGFTKRELLTWLGY